MKEKAEAWRWPKWELVFHQEFTLSNHLARDWATGSDGGWDQTSVKSGLLMCIPLVLHSHLNFTSGCWGWPGVGSHYRPLFVPFPRVTL